MSSVVETLWQIFVIVFYVTGIVFFLSVIFAIISGTIDNHKKKKAVNEALYQLKNCIKELDNKNDKE